MGSLSPWHWLIVVVVLVLLFGSKRLPEAARGLGRSLRILKTEVRQMNAEDAPAPSADTNSSAAGTAHTAPPAQVTATRVDQPVPPAGGEGTAQPEPAPHATTV